MLISEVKHAMSHKLPVIHNGITYAYISACIMRLMNNQWVYYVEMTSFSSPLHVVIACISDVFIDGLDKLS